MIPDMEVIATLTISAQLEKLVQVRHFMTDAAANLPCEEEVIDDLILATDEAVTNIIIHGYQEQEGEICVTVCQQPDACVVILQDNAPPFDPNNAPAPDIQAPLSVRPLGGLGVHLIRQLMDEIHYQQNEAGANELTMIKRLKRNDNQEGTT
ncbi:MAG: ATP-binding protein [Anaerolineae bacterium]|nr:ATP-binding protein [Anaerolineae bacterium]